MNFRFIDHFLTGGNSGYKIILSTLRSLYRIGIRRKTFKLKRYPADFTEFLQKRYIDSVQLSCFFICIYQWRLITNASYLYGCADAFDIFCLFPGQKRL